MNDDHDIAITSDLHLDPSSSDTEHAFARMARHVAADGCRTLVLLGDTFDIDAVPMDQTEAQEAMARLEEILGELSTFAKALASFQETGGTVTMVAGNHDALLRDPDAQSLVVSWLESQGGTGSRLQFKDWIWGVPDLIYAEHGHQLHDVHAHKAWLDLRFPKHRFRLPIGVLLNDPLSHHLAKAGRVTLHLIWQMTAGASRQAHSYWDGVLADRSADFWLSSATLREIDSLSRVSGWQILKRVIGSWPIWPKPTGQLGDYMFGAVAGVSEILNRHGSAVRYLVVGHTHRTAEQQLPGATYLNSGSWGTGGEAVGRWVRIRGSAHGESLAEIESTDQLAGT